MWVAAYFIPFLQVPPSCWGARAKAKRIRHVTQLPITPGIRAFLIPLLIPTLYNRGSLQICFFLRAGSRSCSEGRAFRRVWAVACQLQLPGLILKFTAEIHPLEQSAARGLERQIGTTRDALWSTQHHQRFRDQRATWKRSAPVESEDGCPAGF